MNEQNTPERFELTINQFKDLAPACKKLFEEAQGRYFAPGEPPFEFFMNPKSMCDGSGNLLERYVDCPPYEDDDIMGDGKPFDTYILIAIHALQTAQRHAPCTQPEIDLWKAIRACESALLCSESPIKKAD